MIRHIVVWNFKAECSKEEKTNYAKKIKNDLESLKNIIAGALSIEVIINPLKTSNCDIMLNSVFDSEISLENYQEHPDHKKAGEFIKTVLTDRRCIDYIE